MLAATNETPTNKCTARWLAKEYIFWAAIDTCWVRGGSFDQGRMMSDLGDVPTTVPHEISLESSHQRAPVTTHISTFAGIQPSLLLRQATGFGFVAENNVCGWLQPLPPSPHSVKVHVN